MPIFSDPAEQQAYEQAVADAESSLAAQRNAQAALIASAQVLLNDFIAHASLPVANRDVLAAAALDSRAGTLMAQSLSSSDPRIIGLTAKITALGLRLTRERDDYESGLL